MSTYGTHIQCDTINGVAVSSFSGSQNLESVLTTGNSANLKDINQVQTLRAVDVEVLGKVETVKTDTEALSVEDANGNAVFEAQYSLANSRSEILMYTLPTAHPAPSNIMVWSNGGLLQIGDAIPIVDPGIPGRIWNDGGTLKVSAAAAPAPAGV